jgi:hypothetical protein
MKFLGAGQDAVGGQNQRGKSRNSASRFHAWVEVNPCL